MPPNSPNKRVALPRAAYGPTFLKLIWTLPPPEIES